MINNNILPNEYTIEILMKGHFDYNYKNHNVIINLFNSLPTFNLKPTAGIYVTLLKVILIF